MDDRQYEDLMARLETISGHLKTLVFENRARHGEIKGALDDIDSAVMLGNG